MENNEIILDVKANASDAIAEIERLTQENKALKSSLNESKASYAQLTEEIEKNGGATAEESAELVKLRGEIVRNEQAINSNNAAIRDYTKVIGASVAEEKNKADSIIVMRKQSADLTAQWQRMSAAERESAAGQDLKKHLAELNSSINEAMLSVGNFKDNIGNYKSAVADLVVDNSELGKMLKVVGVNLADVANGTVSASGAAKSMKTAVSGLGSALKAVAKNPFFLAISAFLLVAQNVSAAIKRSEETSNELNVAFARLAPVTDAIKRGFDALAEIAVKAFSVVVETAQKVVVAVASIVDKINSLVGKDSKLAEGINSTIDAQAELTKSTQEQSKRMRDFAEAEVEAELKVARLREQADDRQRYSTAERRKFLEDAIAIETEINNKRIELARKNYELAQKEADRGANDAEANEKLSRAKQEATRAELAYYQKTRELSNKRQEFLAKERQEEEARTRAAEEGARKRAEAIRAEAEALEEYRRKRAEANAAQSEATSAAALKLQSEQIAAAMKAENEKIAALRSSSNYRAEEDEKKHNEIMARLYEEDRANKLAAQEAATGKALEGLAGNDLLDDATRAAAEEQINREHNFRLAQIEADYQRQRTELEVAANAEIAAQREQSAASLADIEQKKFEAVQNGFAALSDVLGLWADESKEAFEAQKAVAIADTIISTYSSAQKAYDSLAGIPIVGPALGAAAAAAAVASGVAKIATIRKTTYQGGSSGGASSSSTSSTTSVTLGGTPSYISMSGSGSSAATSSIGTQSSAVQSASGGGDAMTKRDFLEAVREMPAPQVSVQDINRQQSAVATREQAVVL